jgi:hypothetical protein
MLAIKLRTNLDQFRKGLSDAHQRQVPFARVTAVNIIGRGVQADIVASMKATFDRPTRWTLNATYFKPAHKADMTAFVGIREFAGKGTPAWKYLGPQMEGGPRRQKRFEKAIAFNVPNAPAFALPASGARLNAFGNISTGQINQILSGLGAQSDYTANTTARSSARRNKKTGLIHPKSRLGLSAYFIEKSTAGKPIGVYQLVSKGKVVPVLNFVDHAPTYNAIWPIGEIVLTSIRKHRVGAFEKAWAQALATARP